MLEEMFQMIQRVISFSRLETVNHPEGWTLLYEDPRQPGIASRPAPGFTLPVSAVLRTDATPNPLVAELLVGLSNGYRRG